MKTKPYVVDYKRITIYAAVGWALSCWEEMEETFAHIYIFLRENLGREVIKEYIDEGRIFKDRMTALESAARAYFTKYPNQDLEGGIANLILDATGLSKTRHRIAHGRVVQKLWSEDEPDEDDLYLNPPGYSFKRLFSYDENFAMAPADIDMAADEFVELTRRVEDYFKRLQASP